MTRFGYVALVCALAVVLAPVTAAHAVAADGRIFYSVGAVAPDPDPEAGSQIYSVNPDGTDVVQLTHVPAPSQAGGPDVSPDGRRVLYVSNERGRAYQVWVMRSDGTRQHRLLVDPGHDAFLPRWSPDASSVLFTRCTTPFGFLDCTIAAANADGTGLHDLTGGHWADFSAAYSPDGGTVALSSDRGGYASTISTLPVTGGRPQRITAPTVEAFWPDYRPDGKRILFGNNAGRPHTDFFTMNPDGSEVRQLTDFPPQAQGGFARYAPSGLGLVFDYFDGTDDWLATLDVDGSGLRLLVKTDNLTLADWGADIMRRILPTTLATSLLVLAVAVSPARAGAPVDGLLAISDANTGQIYTLSPTGAHLQQVTHVPDGQSAFIPHWSPDGSRIAYTTVVNDHVRMFTISTDGTGARMILHDGPRWNDFEPDYFPDGSRVAFGRCLRADPGTCTINTVNLDGTGLTQLTPSVPDVFDFFADVSPDGTRIAFVRFNANGIQARVWVMNSDGTDPHPITAPALQGDFPDWAPDGQSLTVTSHCCRLGGDVYRVPATGGPTTRLTTTRYPNFSGFSSTAPSGRRIAFTSDRGYPDKCCSDLYTMKADGSQQTKIDTGLTGVQSVAWGPAPSA